LNAVVSIALLSVLTLIHVLHAVFTLTFVFIQTHMTLCRYGLRGDVHCDATDEEAREDLAMHFGYFTPPSSSLPFI
jgi:hypothetical protein